jgi:hypothetical protein
VRYIKKNIYINNIYFYAKNNIAFLGIVFNLANITLRYSLWAAFNGSALCMACGAQYDLVW